MERNNSLYINKEAIIKKLRGRSSPQNGSKFRKIFQIKKIS